MKFQPSIAQEGLKLIVIPLLVEIIIAAWLWTLLAQAAQERKVIAQSREFVAVTMELTKDFLDAGIYLGAWKSTKSDEFIQKFDAIIAAAPKLYEQLHALSTHDARREAHVAALESNARQILALTSGFRKPTGLAMLLLMDPDQYRRRLAHAYEGFVSEESAVSSEEMEKQRLSPAQEERTQAGISLVLLFGVTANIFFSALMVRRFSKNITYRLAILRDNCRRFAERQPLHQRVAGRDEITDLDLHIHEMADRVRSAERKRDEYVQMVNHDLRAPLAAIQTVLAGTARGLYGELTDKGQSRILDAREDSNRLLELINETMEMDRLESAQFQLSREQFNLSDLIAGAIATLRPLLEQKQIALEYEPIDALINADRPRLHRVVANLLDNAIKYSSSGSTIRIDLTSKPTETMVEFKDEGVGILPSDIDKIFQAYERGQGPGSKEPSGKGLGLAICKVIVEAHGGRIGVKALTPRGSNFWFAIPSS